LRSRDLALLVIAATALLTLVWFFYLYSPVKARIGMLELENEALGNDIALGRAARANLPALRQEVARLARERDLFLAQLPEENEVAELLDQLRGAAGEAQVVFTALQNTGAASEAVQGVRPLSFSLATEGTYNQTIAFLRTLEGLPRFTKVQRVGLSANGEGVRDPRLSASYDFSVYVLTDEGTGETAQEAAPEETGTEATQ